ncbi:MAG: alkaline phosphatase family protein [Bacteroidaceae bacterium]|nr:alkaline phosphatase family protein [Bacteroidaceae bacterium]
MALTGASAQTAPELPRLVVNILVDQLRTDYLEAFAPLYGEGGLKRLMTEARYYADAQQPFRGADRASAAACLSTGAVPYDNGIPALTWLSRQTLRPVYCVDDPAFKGHQTNDCTSARYLLTTTISDEAEMATGGKSVNISICPERDMAVLLAGHTADGAFWLNDQNGSWCGTSYYGDYPYWAEVFDRMAPLSGRIGKLLWEPLYDGGVRNFHYFHSASDTKARDFRHKYDGDRRYRLFKNTVLVNDEVVEFVHRCLEGSDIGKDHLTDILHVGFYAGNYDHQSVVRCPSEIQDTYVRLDRTLVQLFQDIEKVVGKDKVLYVVSSTGYADSDADDIDFAKTRIPTGTFSMQRASMLLNMYLTAMYGQAQYIEATHDRQFYLNHKLIEQKQLKFNEVLARAEEFLAQMEGVRDVYTSSRLALGAWVKGLDRVRAGWNMTRCGDILIDANPGWRIVNDENNSYVNQGEPYIPFPLFFLGPEVVAERISTPVSTAAVAPTLARQLRIRAPNGSRDAPLVLK